MIQRLGFRASRSRKAGNLGEIPHPATADSWKAGLPDRRSRAAKGERRALFAGFSVEFRRMEAARSPVYCLRLLDTLGEENITTSRAATGSIATSLSTSN